ncbi:hypothetical protein B0H11DRAFT_2276468 [Mycena galericulata]|nr:hypothetical protein B0H11DRAFT_2276468 [Mycena galericulata]
MSSSTPFDPLRPSHHLPFPNGRVYPTVALTCGHEYDDDKDTWDQPEGARVTPQFLPCPPPLLPLLTPPTTRKSTGCGTAVHSGATMHWKPHTPQPEAWRAPAAGTSPDVIPLEEKYFNPGAARALGLGALGGCGCVMQGVGCRVCGNALGARLSPCVAHGNAVYRYSFLPGNVSPPLPPGATGTTRPRSFIDHEERRLLDILDASSFPSPDPLFLAPTPPVPEHERGGETHLVETHARDVRSGTARDPELERERERLASGYVYVSAPDPAPAPDAEYYRPGSRYHVERRPQRQLQQQELRALAPPTYNADADDVSFRSAAQTAPSPGSRYHVERRPQHQQVQQELRTLVPPTYEAELDAVFMSEVMEAERTVRDQQAARARMPLPRPPYTGRGVLYGRVTDRDTDPVQPARVGRVRVVGVGEEDGVETERQTLRTGESLDAELTTAAARAVRRRWR